MERLGLVSQLEGDLERIISLGMLPGDGSLPSEQTLAEKYRVSRATAREALVRLSARGLVVQHPGRRARAVAVEEAMTLENLGMALHGAESTHPERCRLLEGYLSLKRDVTVELLVASCGHANTEEMDRLAQACFALADVVRWRHERREWMEREFEFLRAAAMAAGRPGHYLLIQSLERAYRDIARKVLPHLEAQAVNRWAEFAFFALEKRNAQALRTELPQMMRASDEHVLRGLVAARQTQRTLKSHPTSAAHHARSEAPAVSSSTPDPAKPAPEGCRPAPAETGLCGNETSAEGGPPALGSAEVERCANKASAEGGPSALTPPEAGLCADEASAAVNQSALTPAEVGRCADEAGAAVNQSALTPAEVGLCVDKPSSEVEQSMPVPVELGLDANGRSSTTRQSAPAPAAAEFEADEPSLDVGQSAPAPAKAQGPGALCASWSGCQTSSGKAPPAGRLPQRGNGVSGESASGPPTSSPTHKP